MTEDEMIGWHHQLDGHEFQQVPGVGDGQGSLGYFHTLMVSMKNGTTTRVENRKILIKIQHAITL